MDETYRTLAGTGRAAFEVRGSEFVGRVAPAATVEEAEAVIAEANESHPDASHNVPVYRVRVEPDRASGGGRPGGGHLLREWESDDGEPAGSAGKPGLNVLVQRDVENAVGVVTRYFGGTELGVGGLARAYSRAVADAVDDAGVTERRPVERFAVTVDYDDSGTVRSILESTDVEFEAAYEERVRFDVRAERDDAAGVRDRIRSATSGRADVA